MNTYGIEEVLGVSRLSVDVTAETSSSAGLQNVFFKFSSSVMKFFTYSEQNNKKKYLRN